MATVQQQVGQQPGGPSDIQLPPPTGTVLEGIRGKVFADRYALRDESGQAVEHYPEQMWQRVARAIAAVEPDGRRAQGVGGALLRRPLRISSSSPGDASSPGPAPATT